MALRRRAGQPRSRGRPSLRAQRASRGAVARRAGPREVVLVSNGPGEVATWVRTVAAELAAAARDDGDAAAERRRLRLSVVLAPCPHASGGEGALAASFGGVDRVQEAADFWRLLRTARGRSADGEEWGAWGRSGVVVFLGGDQLFALLLAWRLGFRSALYAETDARWCAWAHRYFLRSADLLGGVPARHRGKCEVVGDLMMDAALGAGLGSARGRRGGPPTVALLPGSKPVKLELGLPYFLAVADSVRRQLGAARFVLPLAPTVPLAALQGYADPARNPLIDRLAGGRGRVEREAGVEGLPAPDPRRVGRLVTGHGTEVEIWQGAAPPYELYAGADLCVTTVGTNTAELGALGVPMVVALPTHVLEQFRGAVGGLLGLLMRLPGILGRKIAQLVNAYVVRRSGRLAWPNRWAGAEIVPELVGRVEPAEVAAVAAGYLRDGAKLAAMRARLQTWSARQRARSGGDGEGKAAARVASGVLAEVGLAEVGLAEVGFAATANGSR